MTKAAAIHQFWSGFGLKAYEQNLVPTGDDAPSFPYITYSFSSDDFENEVALTGSLWYRTTSLTAGNAKVEEISEYIGEYVLTDIDGGKVKIKKGSPFSPDRMTDESDTMIKRIIINITVEFMTAY